MAEELNYMTPAGHTRLCERLDFLLRKERPRIVIEVQDAAAQGDRSENAEYIYGKKRLREIDRELRHLNGRLKNAQVVDPKAQRGEVIYFGATVELETEEARTVTYQIVGADETDADTGRISWRAPLGRALLKRRAGDTVTVVRPGGSTAEYTVLSVKYV